MLTVADMGVGGVKNGQKSADVLYGRSHFVSLISMCVSMVCVCHSELIKILFKSQLLRMGPSHGKEHC